MYDVARDPLHFDHRPRIGAGGQAAKIGRLPTAEEYMEYAGTIDAMSGEIYRYLNFDRMDEYQNVADTVKIPVAQAS